MSLKISFSPPVIPESPPETEAKEMSQSPKSETMSPLTSHVSALFFNFFLFYWLTGQVGLALTDDS